MKKRKKQQTDQGAPPPSTPDEAVHRIAATYNGATPVARAPKARVRELAPGQYEQDFGGVAGIVDRIAKKRQARDDREGIVG